MTKDVNDPSTLHPSERLRASDGRSLKELIRDLGEFQQYQVQMGLELFDRMAVLNQKAISIYEKVILVDGATIALSITFLTSLASRVNMGHLSPGRLPLSLVGVSWAFLLGSIYLAYRVITIRQNYEAYFYQSLRLQCSHYMHTRSKTDSIQFSTLPPTVLETGTIDLSKIHAAMAELSSAFGQEDLKKMSEVSAKIKDAPKEGLPARLSVLFALAGVILLCAFALRSLPRLFS